MNRITTGPGPGSRKPYDPTVDSYVYRVYDDYGRLLYVGCSVNPVRRLAGHSSTDWINYATTVDVRGPWPRTIALQIEATAIATEAPYFNAQPEHTRSLQQNRYEARRRMLADGLERIDEDGMPAEEWYDAQDAYELAARDTHPIIDAAERLKRYLAQREFCEQADPLARTG